MHMTRNLNTEYLAGRTYYGRHMTMNSRGLDDELRAHSSRCGSFRENLHITALDPQCLVATSRSILTPYHGSLHCHLYHHPCLIHLDNLSVLETAYTTTNTYLDTSPTGQQPRKDQTPYHEVLRRLCDTLAMAHVLPSPFAECIPFTLNANEAFSHGMPGSGRRRRGGRSRLSSCVRARLEMIRLQ